MPFVWIAFIHGPFLTGLSQHTKEAHFQKGPRTFEMTTSYDGTLLDHLAKHMVYLLMLAATAKVVVVVIVVGTVIVAIVVLAIAVVALVVVLRRPLVLLLCQLVVASCFASVPGIFPTHPSFG
jgi:hypothetical protein